MFVRMVSHPGHGTKVMRGGKGYFIIVPANSQLSPTLQPGTTMILVMAPKLQEDGMDLISILQEEILEI